MPTELPSPDSPEHDPNEPETVEAVERQCCNTMSLDSLILHIQLRWVAELKSFYLEEWSLIEHFCLDYHLRLLQDFFFSKACCVMLCSKRCHTKLAFVSLWPLECYLLWMVLWRILLAVDCPSRLWLIPVPNLLFAESQHLHRSWTRETRNSTC